SSVGGAPIGTRACMRRGNAAALPSATASLAVTDHAVIGYVHGGTVRAEFCASLLAVVMEGRTPVETVLALESGPNISTARNKICDDFLRRRRAPWLFMCDTDMVFGGDTVERLVRAADP